MEDIAAKYYYDREVVVTLPDDMPPGLYDLFVNVTGGRRTGRLGRGRAGGDGV